MGVNSLPKTVTRQRRDCDLNTGPSAPESSTLTTRLPSHPTIRCERSFNMPLKNTAMLPRLIKSEQPYSYTNSGRNLAHRPMIIPIKRYAKQ